MAITAGNYAQEMKRWEVALQQITRLTRANALKWRSRRVTQTEADEAGVVSVYEALFQGTRLRLVQYAHTLSRVQPAQRVETVANDPLDSLAIVDEDGNPAFVFPFLPQVTELQATVRQQLSNLDGFLKALSEAAESVS